MISPHFGKLEASNPAVSFWKVDIDAQERWVSKLRIRLSLLACRRPKALTDAFDLVVF